MGTDKPIYELVFVGQLRWHYRLKHVVFALKALWNALRGYHISVEWN